jgi:hypothetical protein
LCVGSQRALYNGCVAQKRRHHKMNDFEKKQAQAPKPTAVHSAPETTLSLTAITHCRFFHNSPSHPPLTSSPHPTLVHPHVGRPLAGITLPAAAARWPEPACWSRRPDPVMGRPAQPGPSPRRRRASRQTARCRPTRPRQRRYLVLRAQTSQASGARARSRRTAEPMPQAPARRAVDHQPGRRDAEAVQGASVGGVCTAADGAGRAYRGYHDPAVWLTARPVSFVLCACGASTDTGQRVRIQAPTAARDPSRGRGKTTTRHGAVEWFIVSGVAWSAV